MNKEQRRLNEITTRLDSLNSKDILSDSEEREFNDLTSEANKLLRQLEANSIKDALDQPEESGKGYLFDNRKTPEDYPVRAFNISQKEELRKAIRAQGRGNIENPESLKFGRGILSIITGADCPEQRAIGTTGGGGYLIKDELAAQIIPEILADTRVVQAGAVSVPIEENSKTIAKVNSGPSTEWHAENVAYSSGEDVTFTGIDLEPKTLMSIVTMSVEIAEDGLDMERNIESIIRQALANEVDRVCLEGSETNEPTGIVSTDNVLTEVYDSTYGCFSDAYYAIQDENITPSGLIIPSSMMKTLDQLREDGASGAYLAPPKSWEEYRKFISNQIDQAVMGRFTDLLIGTRTQMTVEVSRVAEDYWKKLQVGLRVYMRVDMAVRYPKSFCVISATSS